MVRKYIELAEANVKIMKIFFRYSINIYADGTTHSGFNTTKLNFTRVNTQRVNASR